MINRYINNPYEKKYTAEIKNRINKNNSIYISPKENIIFTGTKNVMGDNFTVNGIKIPATYIDGNLYFNLDSDMIEMEIDYDRRLYLMQQNISNAILRICINKTTNYKIEDYYIDENINKIILNEKDIAFEIIDKLEDLCNYLVFSNSIIKYDKERINIEGFGTSYYSGPFLKRTGEIGIIKISKIYKENSKIILEVLGGKKAYEDYRNKSKNLRNIKSQLFIENEEDILKEIKKIKSKHLESHKEKLSSPKKVNNINLELKRELNEENSQNTIRHPEENEENIDSISKLQGKINGLLNIATLVDGKNYIFKVIKNANIKEMEEISNDISNRKNFIQIYGLVGLENSTSSILISRSKNLNFDLKKIYIDLLDKFEMKGSGNMFQLKATVRTEDLSKIMESFLITIKNQ